MKKLPQNLQDWVEARKRHRLSHAQVQMARELKRFGREGPELVMSIEERARLQAAKQAARRESKRRARGGPA